MKKITLASVLASFCLQLTAQENTIKPLSIGDTVPDIAFNHLVNTPVKTAKLSNFKGKYLILDLWSNSCRSCIEAFPKMQELQHQFGKTLQIILANPHTDPYETDQRALAILKNVEQHTGIRITLPVALKDTILNQLFPHRSVPHVIITDTARRIIAITTSAYITEQNIRKLTRSEPVWFPFKNELDFDRKKPLLVAGNGGNTSQYLYRSLFTGYLDGAEAATGWDRDANGKPTRYYIINYPLRGIYRFAWLDALNRPANQIIVEADNPARFQAISDSSKDLTYYYSYELSAPGNSPEQFRQYLREDLERFFRATVVKETREIPCFVLKVNGSLKSTLATASQPKVFDTDPYSKNKKLSNQPIKEFIDLLNDYLAQPVLDETGIREPVTIALPYELTRLSAKDWNLHLKKYGLVLEAVTRPIEVAIIKNTITP